MKYTRRSLAILLILSMLLPFALAACQDPAPGPTPSDPPGGGGGGGEEYMLPLEDGYNQVTFYWTYEGSSYENCDMWIWWGDVAGKGYLFHECEYGAKVVVNVPEGVSEIGFIVRRDCS